MSGRDDVTFRVDLDARLRQRIVARVLDNRDFPRWSDILLTIGSFALPWMFYSSIFLIAYDFCLLFASLFDVSYLLFPSLQRSSNMKLTAEKVNHSDLCCMSEVAALA